MSFNDFVHKYGLQNEATSNIKIQQILSSLSRKDVGLYSRDGSFESDIGIVNLRPSKGTHWVPFTNQNFFDSYGCSPPQNLSKFIIKRNGYCLFSEYKTQGVTSKRDSSCATFSVCIICLTKVSKIDFKSAV